MLRSPRPVGRLLRILATNSIAAAMYALLLGSMVSWTLVLTYFLISLIYANVIGTAAHLIMPVVGGRLSRRAPAVHWLGLAATLFGVTVVSSLLAGTIAAALGLFGSTPTWAAQRTGLGIALVLAMTVGMGIAVYESMRARLDEAREGLRVRELEVERAQRLATDARLASLESRLHPHFLFNALAAIAGQVREAPGRHHDGLVAYMTEDEKRGYTGPLKTAEQGAATSVWCATSSQLDGKGGVYCLDCEIAEVVELQAPEGSDGVIPWAIDPDSAERLWGLSENMTGVKLSS